MFAELVSVRRESDPRVVRRDDAPVGLAGTVVVINTGSRSADARVRLPDGGSVPVASQSPTPEGYELVIHRPLPPGTRIELNGTVLRLPATGS